MIEIIDTHTAGEPTRVVIGGGPELAVGSLAERVDVLKRREDWLRTALILEPRGSEAMVGALLVEPTQQDVTAGVIFFNNVGYLGMCGHGLMGVVETLRYLGRIAAGEHRFETPVGTVSATLHAEGSVSITNVESFRETSDVTVQLSSGQSVTGDVAYGGNWFFLVPVSQLHRKDLAALAAHCQEIRLALAADGITGSSGEAIDHIELCAPFRDRGRAGCQSFVLCPGGQYDRSPCGTGTSAKLACLAADGRLLPGEPWYQESIIGSQFIGRYTSTPRGVIPVITGRAHVTAEMKVVIDPLDPFRFGIRRGEA